MADQKINFTSGPQYEIYIGIKDKDSYFEEISAQDFMRMLIKICTRENICFSLVTQFGGYNHNQGYTTETSLRIILIGATEEIVIKLGEELKRKVNTDTILISKSDVDFAFI